MLTIALAGSALTASPAPASRLCMPRLDPSSGALVVPYVGPAPASSTGSLSRGADQLVYFDFVAGSMVPFHHGEAVAGQPWLRRWAIVTRLNGRMRVVLTVPREARVAMCVDAARHQLVLTPKVEAAPEMTGVFRFQVHTDARNDTYSMLVERLKALPKGASPVLSAGPVGMPPASGSAAEPSTPAPAAVSPSPTSTVVPPSPASTPAPASPAPAARPVPSQVAAPASAEVGVTFAPLNYQESYSEGGVQTRGVAAPALGVRWTQRVPSGWSSPGWLAPDWRFAAGLDLFSASYQDRVLPLSMHVHDEWRFEGHWARATAEGHLLQGLLGLGYMARADHPLHTGAPSTPSYLFTNQRIFHGPSILLGGRLAPTDGFLQGWALTLSSSWMPLVWSAIDVSLPPLPSLNAYTVEAGIERRFGPLAFQAGYRRWSMQGPGYEEIMQGPYVSLGGDLGGVWPR